MIATPTTLSGIEPLAAGLLTTGSRPVCNLRGVRLLGRTGAARRGFAFAGAVTLAATLIAGCSDFSDQASPGTFTPKPSLRAEKPPQPEGPNGTPGANSAPQSKQRKVPPPKGCTDYHQNVIGTCLHSLSAVATLPENGSQPSALAAERKTGRVMQVSKGANPTQLAKLDVDPAGGGGLTGVALSPHYNEDQLIYAYVTTAKDNEVVRFAAKQPPKPVLKGIPKGSSGNAGKLALDHKGALLVATGDAGKPKAAKDPKSLAGKVLRIDGEGKPAHGNPKRDSPIISSGLHSPGGVCATSNGSKSYVTDRGGSRDAVFRVEAGGKLAEPTWSWPDKPGVAGCSATDRQLSVNTVRAGNMQGISLNRDGSVNGKPQVGLAGKDGFGRLSGMDAVSSKLIVVGTANKDGGKPVSSDDRVFIIQRESGGGTGKD